MPRHQTPPRYLTAASTIRPIAAKRDVIHKTGSAKHTATPPEEDRATATGDVHENLVKIGPAVPEICSRTDRQTHTHRQTN